MMFGSQDAPGFSPNYTKAISDEIALEGLDGITLNDLWLRLENRPLFPLKPSDESVRSFLWESTKRLREVAFYELLEPRKPLVLYDRFTNIDPVFGVFIELENVPENIYPVCKIEDTANGVIGSCSTYHTRSDVSSIVRTLSLPEVSERWGHKLVIVASQMARRRALMNMDVNPNLELTVMQYIVLERVGRSRYHGEITQGQDSLQAVGEDAKSLFYLRKLLHKQRLITKQMFHQKLGAQNACGLLLHLPRFYVERRPKALTLIEQVVNYLKAQPNYSAELNKIREDLDMGVTLKKLSKTFNFQKFVKSEVVLYRTMYPDADVSEWRYKGANKERSLRVLSLINPSVEGKDVWQKYDDIYDDDDDDKCGLLDEGSRLLDRTLMWQAFSILEKKGPEGVTQVELGNLLGAPKLLARMIIRNLQKSKQVTSFMRDEGRQRTAMFALQKFDKCSDIKKQMVEEHGKLIKFIKKSSELSKSFKSEPGTSSQSLEDSILFDNVEVNVPEIKPESSKGKANSKTLKKTSTKSKKETETKKANPESIEAEVNKSVPEKTIQGNKKRKADDTEAPNTDSFKKNAKRKKPNPEKSETDGEVKTPEKQQTPKESSTEKIANFQAEEIAIEVKETKPNKTFIGKSLLQSSLAVKPGDSVANSVSFRLLKRTNIIMEAVNKQQVIFDSSKLSKLICEEEAKEGYDVRMDKKSLLRIINKLAYEGHLKYLTITLKAYRKEKVLNFICHPSVPNDHSVIQSAVDQAKMKFHILGKEAVKKKENKVKKVIYHEGVAVETLHESNEKNPEEEFNLKYNQTQGRVYGFKPKYMRMQVLHKYMFYLIYGYEGEMNKDQAQARAQLRSLTTAAEDVEPEMSQIYNSSALDYKTFLPPLPEHSGYSEGWALMSDLLLRMPLSLFVQVVNVMYEMPELEDYLNHPVRKHFLVKNLPLKFRNTLTYARKYIFTIHELVTRLCCSGLIQMGPQRLKEKDQVFVFLNRRALLVDTTASSAGYHQVAADLDYPEHLHYFGNMSDVDQYWCDLWNYCMHTMLGGRMCMGNNTIVLESYQTKPELSGCMEPRGVEEAPLRDIGYLPGDHKGAAGFDSCTFPHLKRNWYWSTSNMNLKTNSSSANVPTTDLQPVVQKPKTQTEATVKKVTSKSYRMMSETSSARRKVPAYRPTKVSSSLTLSANQRSIKKTLIGKKTVRLLKQRIRGKRRPYYDQVDKEALLKMSKLRVDWSAKEDNVLLLCKVATMVFQFIGRKGYQNLVAVRQILHEQCPKSSDKTSRACQRRLNYMMKNQRTQRSVNLCLEEMKQDTVIMEKLQIAKEEMEANANLTQAQREDEWTKHYHDLVRLLQNRYERLHAQELSQLAEGFELPDTAHELLENYRVTRPQKLQKSGFHEISAISDIHSGVINATILSALNSVGDKTSWSYQLFSIYQQYPDKLMRSVMAKTRSDQMISMRKHYLRTHVRSGDYLPLSSSPYQLSINYINLLMVRYQFELYSDCMKMLEELQTGVEEDTYQEVLAAKGGAAAAVVELASQDQIDFKIDIPEQIIVMDPNVIKKDESYTRIVKRYQDILFKCKEKNQVTITAVFDEAYNAHSQDGSEDEDDDEEEMRPAAGNTVAKAASRIALYFNRDETSTSSNVADTHNELQHAHDFFLVNSSRVFCQFKNPDKKYQKVPEDFIPLSNETIQGVINKVKRLATFPTSYIPKPEIVDELSEKLEISPQLIQEIIDFIRSKGEFGVTKDDIKAVYGLSVPVARVLASLVDAQVCLKAGVNHTHWVHAEFHAPWIIKSYRLLRPDKEKLIRIDHRNYGMLMKIGGKGQDDGEEKMETDGTNEKQDANDAEPSTSTAAEDVSETLEPTPSTSTSDPPPTKRKIKPPSRFDDEEDYPQDQESSGDFSSYVGKKVKRVTMAFDNKFKCDLSVCVRPWIRIDGSLNRRVLDKFLSSVLGHVMMYPLCSLQNIQERFTPAFQPQHTYELVEILEELQCIKVLAVQRSHKISLFSKPSQVITVPATGLESEEDLVLEPDALAVTKLSLFIGDSTYQKDVYSVFSPTQD